MSLPPQKPWESGGGRRIENSRLNNIGNMPTHTYQNIPTISSAQSSSYLGSLRTTGPPPPLPARPSRYQYSMQRASPYGYGSGYGMSPYPMYGNYGGYNSFGPSGLGYGYGQSLYPMNDFESRFIQMAEESSRPAFQSIESVVRAFSSVSMMLESTFHAMYSSFRAVIGVAENFSRLRQLFVQFFSAITVLKFAQNFLRRFLHWLGIIPEDPASEMLWQNAQASTTNRAVAVNSPARSAWPVFAFLGLLFGGPFLMSRLLGQSITGADSTEHAWNPEEQPGMPVVAVHSFQAASSNELSFKRGEKLQLAPPQYYQQDPSSGWVLAANQEGQIGHIPANRIARLVKVRNASSVQSQPSNVSPPVPEPVSNPNHTEDVLPTEPEKPIEDVK